jgi:hypothetical protein
MLHDRVIIPELSMIGKSGAWEGLKARQSWPLQNKKEKQAGNGGFVKLTLALSLAERGKIWSVTPFIYITMAGLA